MPQKAPGPLKAPRGSFCKNPFTLEKKDFFKRLNNNSNMELFLVVEDDYVVEATLSS